MDRPLGPEDRSPVPYVRGGGGTGPVSPRTAKMVLFNVGA